MGVQFARSTARELTYRVFGRGLHPELFNTCAARVVRQAEYRAVLRICDSGHVVEFGHKNGIISEVNTTAHHELPRRGLCLSIPLKGGRDVGAEPVSGIQFKASTQIEWLDPEVFERLTLEFRADLRLATVFQVFAAHNRLRPAPLSLLHADCAPTSLVVHAFHTFSDEYAVVRTQSLYEF